MKPVVTLAITLAFFSQPALAHTGHMVHYHGFTAGLLHPLTGADHLIALLLSGVLAAQLPLRQRFLSDAVVFAALLLGTALGSVSGGSTLLEGLLLASCLLMAAAAIRQWFHALSAVGTTSLLGAVMLLHGWAHGAELPAGQAAPFITGFMLCALLLLATGMGIALTVKHFKPVIALSGAQQ